MKSPEERIAELEQRVAYLENIVNRLETNEFDVGTAESDDEIYDRTELIIKQPIKSVSNGQSVENKQINNQGDKGSDKEALVGRYIVGVLAAVLIFVGAVSFVGLIWNQITPAMKLSIISLAGILLSTLGFWLIRTKKNPITSIILGMGAGLLFIAILSANLAFHMIGNSMFLFLVGIWSILFIVSSRYTNLFFTKIIAYIGSYITLILGLSLMSGDGELLLLVLYVSGISGIMIYTSLQMKKLELITSLILSLISYSTILIRCYMDGSLEAGQLLSGFVTQIAVILIIYLLMNMFYKVINENRNTIPMYLIVSGVTTILTVSFISYLNTNYLNWTVLSTQILFFIINLIQFVLNRAYYKGIEQWLTRYYTILLVLASVFINMELFTVPTGIVMIGLLLLISEKIFKTENQSLLIGIIVLFDALFLILNASGALISSIYGIIQLGIMLYVLWQCNILKEYTHMNILKTMGIIVTIINSFAIPANIINYMSVTISEHVAHVVGYLIAVIFIVVLLKRGYFKNWKNQEFDFFGRNDTLENDKSMQPLIYIVLIGLYFYGLKEIVVVDLMFLKLLITLATVAGIWIVAKYLILTWTVIGSFLDVNLISVVYSIAGLMVAITSIYAGFKLKSKSIRLYGLVLTILMVAKFIVVDLNQENSINRVLALIAGGGLCFLITFIYNKLSENV